MRGGASWNLRARPSRRWLMIIENANHVDLYDRMEKCPFNTITEFFGKNPK
jgi:hypothetical protein